MTEKFVINTDHKDRVRDNNTWNNLREATDTQNNVNIIVRKNNKLGIKGVCAFKGRFRAYIKINRQSKIIGLYNTKEEAELAYKIKAKELHGEFYNDGE